MLLWSPTARQLWFLSCLRQHLAEACHHSPIHRQTSVACPFTASQACRVAEAGEGLDRMAYRRSAVQPLIRRSQPTIHHVMEKTITSPSLKCWDREKRDILNFKTYNNGS